MPDGSDSMELEDKPYKGPEHSYNPTLRVGTSSTQAIPKEDYAKNPGRRNFLKGLGAVLGVTGVLGALGIGVHRVASGQADGPEPGDAAAQAASQDYAKTKFGEQSRMADPKIISPDHLPKNAATMEAVGQQQPTPTPPIWERHAGGVTRTPTPEPVISPDQIKKT